MAKIEVEHRNYSEEPYGVLKNMRKCRLEWVLSNGNTISEERCYLKSENAYNELTEVLQKKLDELNGAHATDIEESKTIPLEELVRRLQEAIDKIDQRIDKLEKDIQPTYPYPWTTTPKPNNPWDTPNGPLSPFPWGPGDGPFVTYYSTTTYGPLGKNKE